MSPSLILAAAGTPWPAILSGLVVVLMAAAVWYVFVYRQPTAGPQAFTRLGPFYVAARPFTVEASPTGRIVRVDWQVRNENTTPQTVVPAGIALVLDQTPYLPLPPGGEPFELQPRETRSVPAAYELPLTAAEALAAGRADLRVAMRQTPDSPLSMALPIALRPRED